MGELMRVFAVERKHDDGVWHVWFLHKHDFRMVLSHSSTLMEFGWRIRRVKTQEELAMLQRRFGVSLKDHGHKEEIEWAS